MRTTPRPRRELSPRAITVLRPLFRQSYVRSAWILRGVGERFGPVLVERAPARPGPGSDRSPGAPAAQ